MNRKAILVPVAIALFLVGSMLAILNVGLATAEPAHSFATQAAIYPDQREAVEKAVTWLVQTHQNDDGGYTGFSIGANEAASDVAGTLDAILAIASTGFNPAAPAPGKENTPIDFLLGNVDQLEEYAAVDGGQAGKVILALVAANQDPRDFGGTDFVALLMDHGSIAGHFGAENTFGQSLAMLALRAVSEPVSDRAINWLTSRQAAGDDLDGSWDDGFGTQGNADATAMSMMALASTGLTVSNESLARGLDFVLRTRLESGGWEYGAGFGENVNSTALVVQALSAIGYDFSAAGEDGASPLATLLSWQSEAGAFQADYGDGRFDDFLSTVQAIPAATGKPFPLLGRLEAARRAVGCLSTLQDSETGGWEQFATFGVNAAGTSRAIQAIVAMGDDPTSAQWEVSGINAVQALENLTPEYLASSRGGGVGIVLQGVVAAGGDVNDFAGTDLILEMSGHLSPTGEYDDTSFGPFSQAEAMLGLLAAGARPDPSAVDWLLNAQDEGDWGGADSTGLALSVLGQQGLAVEGSLEVLHATQGSDGGWGFGGAANPSSSSEVAQGLVTMGENPFAPAWSQEVSGTVTNAADAILALQGESGCWPNQFGPGEDPFSTMDAVLLLVKQPGWGPAPAVPMPIAAEDTEATPEAVDTPEPAPEPTQQVTVASDALPATPRYRPWQRPIRWPLQRMRRSLMFQRLSP
jgi:hypothetical protein